MAEIADVGQAAEKLRQHIRDEAKNFAPGPVVLTVVDGSQQLNYGYVWCTYGDKRVQCLAPANVGDLRLATEANPMLIWAIPPNPDQVSGYQYVAFGFGQNAADVGGYGAGRVPPLMATVVNDPDGNPISGGSGTVTSVALSASPSGIFDVAGSPITTSGTLALSLDNQSANTVLAGPTGGGAATPDFRALVANDIPSLAASKITSGQLALARGGTASDLSATGPGFLYQASSGAVVTIVSAYTTVKKAGSAVAQRANLNFIDGGNVTITVADNSGTSATDVTIAAAAPGGGGVAPARSEIIAWMGLFS